MLEAATGIFGAKAALPELPVQQHLGDRLQTVGRKGRVAWAPLRYELLVGENGDWRPW